MSCAFALCAKQVQRLFARPLKRLGRRPRPSLTNRRPLALIFLLSYLTLFTSLTSLTSFSTIPSPHETLPTQCLTIRKMCVYVCVRVTMCDCVCMFVTVCDCVCMCWVCFMDLNLINQYVIGMFQTSVLN